MLIIASSSSLFRHSIPKQHKELQVARRPQAFSWRYSQVRLTLYSRIALPACAHCLRRMHKLRSLVLPELHSSFQAIAHISCSVSTSQWRNLAQRCLLSVLAAAHRCRSAFRAPPLAPQPAHTRQLGARTPFPSDPRARISNVALQSSVATAAHLHSF
jgi:hypothetical protein